MLAKLTELYAIKKNMYNKSISEKNSNVIMKNKFFVILYLNQELYIVVKKCVEVLKSFQFKCQLKVIQTQ